MESDADHDATSLPLAQMTSSPPPCTGDAQPREVTQARTRTNRKTGRPRDREMWETHFHVNENTPVGQTHPDATCNYCRKDVGNGQPNGNMLKHLLRHCSGIDNNVRIRLERERGDRLNPPRKPSKRRPSVIPQDDEEIDHQQPTVDQDAFEFAVARLFYMCALSFLIIDAPAFKELFAMVAPGLKHPSRKKLAGDLLQRVRDDCRANVIAQIKEQRFVSIVTDSWTDTNRTSIINFMVVAPGMPSLLWSSLSSGTARHDAAYLAGEMARVINEILVTTGAVVAGVLTDNASNVTAAWKKLERTMPIFGGGCVLNLLIQDVCKNDQIKELIKAALELTRKKVITSDSGRRRTLVLPVKTRWYTMHACLRSVLDNKNLLKSLFLDHENEELISRFGGSKDKEIKLDRLRTLVEGPDFWRKLELAVGYIDLMIESLRALERDDATASMMYSQFRFLLLHSKYVDKAQDDSETRAMKKLFRDAIQYRWNYVHTDFAGIAFMLDPATNTDHFIGSGETTAITQACKYAERSGMLARSRLDRADLSNMLADFVEHKASWDAEKRDQYGKMKPKAFWFLYRKRYPVLRELANVVFAIPASSAASERAWSIMDFIHTKKRNRLSIQKVEMLTYVYINDGSLSKQRDYARIQSHPESIDAVVANGG